jgi:DNA-binding winged helix-turn-helix (wHTH) protein
VLLENRGRIVEKQDLLREVWDGAFVEEGDITYTIGLLRKTLNDDSHAPKYIETVSKRGYRFIAEVAEQHSTNDCRPEPTEREAPSRHSSTNLRRRGLLITFGLLIAGSLTAGAWLVWPRHSGPAQPTQTA